MDRVQLIEQSVQGRRGILSRDGALMVRTGESTGRSTKERFVVRWPDLENEISWGAANQAVSPSVAEALFPRLEKKLMHGEHYTMQGHVGCFRVCVISTSPWHIAFARNMFREQVVESLKALVNEDLEITILHDPEGRMSQYVTEFPYEKGIVVDPKNLCVAIVGTAYAGEIKKSAFSLCNYLFPKFGIMPMHASANCLGDGSQSSVLFGLSGTGKTTLSADPTRHLIGDDEIVWSANGLSNLEGGCYAKLINLDPTKEPDIFRAANRFGSILENVAFNSETREIDFDDSTITENSRASYGIDALGMVFNQTREAAPPSSIIFLTADAFGALPAVARLNAWQAQYHFASGYTAKVAGTEIGVKEPTATFSACFGAPFMPRSPAVYASLLAQYIDQHNVPVWILNTGWTGGGYGVGSRFPIPVSRQILSAIQSGALENSEMVTHPVFGFKVPVAIPGVDSQYLTIPEGPAVMDLAKRFVDNANSKKDAFTAEMVAKGGPVMPGH